MASKPVKIDEQISYNWLFFLLAGVFGLVTFWAVYDEILTRREYKDYQEESFKIEIELAEKALKENRQTLAANAEYKSAVLERKRLEDELAGTKRSEYQAAKKRLQELEYVAFDKQQGYTFTKSSLDESYYYYTKAKHEAGGGTTQDLQERETTLRKYEEQLKKDEEAALEAAKVRDGQAKVVKGYTASIEDLKKQIDKFEDETKAAERKYAAAVEKLHSPLGPQTEIVQQNLEAMGRVDRCESCHTGANRGGFETVQPAYFQSHPFRRTLFALHPVEKFGCTTCHDGQGRATTKFYAHAPTDSPRDFEKHFWEQPVLKGAYMEANCRKCHTEQVELRSTIRCEVDAECNPRQGMKLKCDVPSQPVAPSDTSLPNFLPVALESGAKSAAKYCVNPDSGIAELVDLAPHLSRGRKVIEEVGCYSCHPMEGYEKKAKPAPDLRHVAAKLNPAWMVEWIRNPKAIHPRSRMPNFFPEELNPKDYVKAALPIRADKSKNPGEPWKWTVVQQTSVLTSFLLAQSAPWDVPRLPVAGDARRGKELVLNLGCRGCHNITEDEKDPSYINYQNRGSHFDHGPNLGNVGSKTSVEWLYVWLKDPKKYSPETRMPSLRLSDQEAADIAVYLSGNKDKRKYTDQPLVNPSDKVWVDSGKKLMNYYGCYGCHYINGFEQTAGIGAELTEFGNKEVARLDFGDYIVNHTQQTWDSWLENKLKHPRVYRYERVDTRMPQFDLTEEEITDVMVVFKGMRGKTADAQVAGHKLSPSEIERELGRDLVRWYNCSGCHIIDGHAGDIRQAVQYAGDKATFAPPNISGEGAKTQPPWLFGFFKQVIPLRPWLEVRMPSFHFDDTEATCLVAMFSAIDHADYPYRYYDVKNESPKKEVGAALFASLKCASCHLVGDVNLSPEDAAKAAPNLLLARNRLRPEWIIKWLSNPDWVQPGTRMPSFWSGGLNLLQTLVGTPDGKRTFGSLLGLDQVSDSPLHQMEVVRDHVFNLGGERQTTTRPAKKTAKTGRTGAHLFGKKTAFR